MHDLMDENSVPKTYLCISSLGMTNENACYS